MNENQFYSTIIKTKLNLPFMQNPIKAGNEYFLFVGEVYMSYKEKDGNPILNVRQIVLEYNDAIITSYMEFKLVYEHIRFLFMELTGSNDLSMRTKANKYVLIRLIRIRDINNVYYATLERGVNYSLYTITISINIMWQDIEFDLPAEIVRNIYSDASI